MSVLKYIVGAATAWFVGFFPYFEIYIAVPSGLAAGLDWFSAFLWAAFGNWVAIPFVDLCYEWLLRFKFMEKIKNKAVSGKWKARIEKNGALFILLLTPLAGVWTIAVIAKALGYNRYKLWLFSGISVGVTAFIIAFCMNFGIKIFA